MKRRFFFIFFTLTSIWAHAHINTNDSTASIVAYWNLGDKYTFECVTEKQQIIGNDTTILNKSTEQFSLEVVDSTETNYILKYEIVKSARTKTETALDSLIEEKIRDLSMDLPILIQTDHLGTFEEISNGEEIIERMKVLMDLLGDELWKAIPEETKSAYLKDKDTFMTNAFAPLLKKEFLSASLNHVIQLLHFHGAEYDKDEIYNYTEQRASIFDDSMIDSDNQVWVEEVDEEEGYVYMCYSSNFNGDQLMSGYMNYIGNITENIEMPGSTEMPYIFMEDSHCAAIHTGSGWTTSSYYEFRSEVKNITTLETIEVNMVFNDDPEESPEPEK